MPITDNRTPNRSYQLPFSGNNLSDDLARFVASLGSIDTDVGTLFATMSGKVDATALGNYQLLSGRNAANGYAGLNASAQIDESVLPTSIRGGLVAKGNWNATTNSPVIPPATTGNKGWLYFVTVDGTTSINTGIDTLNDWAAGDALWSDGALWRKLDSTDRVTSVAGRVGNVVLNQLDIGGIRERLTANRTYYIRTDGSDANSGLLNTVGGAFLTLQKAFDTVANSIDFAGNVVTIQLADGTYTVSTGSPSLGRTVGQSTRSHLVLKGNLGTPANVVLNSISASSSALIVSQGARITVQDLKLQSGSGGRCLWAYGAEISYQNLDFGACPGGIHVLSELCGGQVTQTGLCFLSGDAGYHIYANRGGTIDSANQTLQALSARNWASYFAVAGSMGQIVHSGGAFTGSAHTGNRYLAIYAGLINVSGAGANYFPGSVAGGVSTNGQYL